MSLEDAQVVRILIVEDDLRLANMLRLGLEEEGFGVDLVDNGEEALAAATATPFDLVTVDVMLPGTCRSITSGRPATAARGSELVMPFPNVATSGTTP